MKKINKVQSLEDILNTVKKVRKSKKKIITTNGCFDILHIGHMRNLKFAKELGDVLIVGVNSDSSVRKLKGIKRPIIPAKERAELIAALDFVDYVFIMTSEERDENRVAKLRGLHPVRVKSYQRI